MTSLLTIHTPLPSHKQGTMFPYSLYLIFTLSVLSPFLFASAIKMSSTVTVNKYGGGNFTMINDAIRAAPNNSNGDDGYFVIKVMAGVYHEYVQVDITKSFIVMIGAGINRTIITGNHSYVDGWSTPDSATFSTSAPNFIGMYLTIRNTAGPAKGQAVALYNSGNLSIFYRCSIEGYQDTLYAYSRWQFYRECDVYGTVDFIFGSARAVFQKCNIYARQPIKGQANEITAQGRQTEEEESGIVIQGCFIKPTDELTRSTYTVKTYLGRPWKIYSTTVIMESVMDGFIDQLGWDRFSGDLGLETLYYAEYKNTGPGSNTSNRVKWPGYHLIDINVASKFTVSKFLDGDTWIPRTMVPYIGGLITT